MTATVHAGAVALGEAGVLIRGAPGSGKSALARALVALWQREGAFAAHVADDRTALTPVGSVLIARPAPALAGRIEVRGVGIRAVPFLPAVRISLVVDLVAAPERLPDPADATVTVAGIALPRLFLEACAAEHTAHLLRSVVTDRALTPADGEAQPVAVDRGTFEGKPR